MLGGVDFYVSILNTDLSPSETNEREWEREGETSGDI